jgi:hypothetical protein
MIASKCIQVLHTVSITVGSLETRTGKVLPRSRDSEGGFLRDRYSAHQEGEGGPSEFQLKIDLIC